MAQRIRNLSGAFNSHPFTGEGVSLYVTVGSTVQYRNTRIVGRGRRWIKGTTGVHDIASSSVQKTARRASAADPATSIPYSIPASMASQTLAVDVRKYRDNVENESDNFRTQRVTLDANRAAVTKIFGTAELLDLEVRAGGIVRLRFVYFESREGVQPTLFRASRTAGPTSPAAVTESYYPGKRLVEIDTPALSDSSPYTYKITAENSATTLDVITGITVQADSTGPPAPTVGTARAV